MLLCTDLIVTSSSILRSSASTALLGLSKDSWDRDSFNLGIRRDLQEISNRGCIRYKIPLINKSENIVIVHHKSPNQFLSEECSAGAHKTFSFVINYSKNILLYSNCAVIFPESFLLGCSTQEHKLWSGPDPLQWILTGCAGVELTNRWPWWSLARKRKWGHAELCSLSWWSLLGNGCWGRIGKVVETPLPMKYKKESFNCDSRPSQIYGHREFMEISSH